MKKPRVVNIGDEAPDSFVMPGETPLREEDRCPDIIFHRVKDVPYLLYAAKISLERRR